MNTQNDKKHDSSLRKLLFGDDRLSARFRRVSILLFLLALLVMMTVMVTSFYDIVSKISYDYTRQTTVNSADSLGTHILKEINLLSAAAQASAVIDWLADEYDDSKKDLANMELSKTIDSLYSNSLYIANSGSFNEYKVEGDYPFGGITPVDVLEESNYDDEWFFSTLDADIDYTLSIGIDKVAFGKRVWVNYKITADGNAVGVISTGLEFAHIAGELFAQFNDNTIHGAIINEDGIIYMDSSLLRHEDFLRNEYNTSFETTYTEPAIVNAIKKHLDTANGYSYEDDSIEVIELTRPYRYAAIARIDNTDWHIVIVYDSSPLLDVPLFLPTAVSMFILLVVFAIAINSVSHRFVFQPLDKLRESLVQLKQDNEENLYGIERNDEIGELAGSIKDWFTKANYDAMTGIYNRRYMENNLNNILGILARTDGTLSVLMMDVDYFKKYNDSFGHDQGDVCLKAVAKAISAGVMRSGDFAARYGGEEFILVLPNTDNDGAQIVAEKVLNNVHELKLPHPKSDAADVVTVSVGVTSGKVAYGQTPEEFIKRADEALYASKQNGRNCYTCLEMG